jgi:hypothetical protein
MVRERNIEPFADKELEKRAWRQFYNKRILRDYKWVTKVYRIRSKGDLEPQYMKALKFTNLDDETFQKIKEEHEPINELGRHSKEKDEEENTPSPSTHSIKPEIPLPASFKRSFYYDSVLWWGYSKKDLPSMGKPGMGVPNNDSIERKMRRLKRRILRALEYAHRLNINVENFLEVELSK